MPEVVFLCIADYFHRTKSYGIMDQKEWTLLRLWYILPNYPPMWMLTIYPTISFSFPHQHSHHQPPPLPGIPGGPPVRAAQQAWLPEQTTAIPVDEAGPLISVHGEHLVRPLHLLPDQPLIWFLTSSQDHPNPHADGSFKKEKYSTHLAWSIYPLPTPNCLTCHPPNPSLCTSLIFFIHF